MQTMKTRIEWSRTIDSPPAYYGPVPCGSFIVRQVSRRRWRLSRYNTTARKWEPLGEPHKRLADAKLTAEIISSY